jgi:dTDP-4-dehydrorhamnose 3,5-epimerase-like enzyme
MSEPIHINGAIAVDDRGSLSFVNDFNFKDVKRFYMIENHAQGFVRAWHGHKKEGKYFHVVQGSALICGVLIDNWEKPSKELPVARYVLSDKKPSILYLPPGYANGLMSLEEETKIMVFSTSTLDESKGDDFRFEARYWNPWTVEER